MIDAAHRRGKLAVVHILSGHSAKDVIQAGADGLVHLFADQVPDEEFLSLAAQHHVFVIATLSVLAAPSGVSAGLRLARDPRLEPYLSVEAIGDLNPDVPRHMGNLQYARGRGPAPETARRADPGGNRRTQSRHGPWSEPSRRITNVGGLRPDAR